jgi:hypothetical protein
MAVKTHVRVDWFCCSVDTFDNRNSIRPASVQWLHGTKPELMLETVPPISGVVRIWSPGRTSVHAMIVKEDEEPCTTNGATSDAVERMAEIAVPPPTDSVAIRELPVMETLEKLVVPSEIAPDIRLSPD